MTNPPEDEHDYPYWTRVYVTVIIYTIVLIAVLWFISKQFQ
jgi:hypothetical protein